MNNRSPRELPARLLWALSCLAVASCAQREVVPEVPSRSIAEAAVTMERYRIQPGDELEIRFFHTPERDVLLPVRPDGYISLPLVYELQAAGRTPEDLRVELVQRYREELADPELAVIVRVFGTYQVHVGGEVNQPGVLQLRGPQNVLEAVLAAGGFLPSADLSEVLLIRRDPVGFEVHQVDVDKLLEGEEDDGSLALRPYDVVYVPRSPIAEVNKWVDLYLRRNIPINFSIRPEAF